ncbi:hypothetical protein GF406_08730 [candidate division KSB1 bacterium]|nr:hypothetical protein [candidate division KSB1 bacterium]
MARIKTLSPESTRGIRRFLLTLFKKQYGGFLPGIFRIALVDLKIGFPTGNLYKYLHLRKKSPLTRVQREMVATVVNGLIGGAP